MKWLIPLIVILFAIGKLMEAWRLAQGSVYEDIEFLRAAINDVRKRAKALEPDNPAVGDVEVKLAAATIELEWCEQQLPTATAEERKLLRRRLKRAMTMVALARSDVEKNTPPDAHSDAD